MGFSWKFGLLPLPVRKGGECVSFALKNQRSSVRHHYRTACKIQRVGQVEVVRELGLDLSPEGMMIATDEAFEVGERLEVAFRATDLEIWFETEADVVRVVQGRRQEDWHRGIGIAFRTLNSVQRLALGGHLRRFPPPVPRSLRERPIDYAETVRRLAAG